MAERGIPEFEQLILPHLDDAYTLARYLLRDEHDAQDVVQEACLRAHRYFASFRDGDGRAWLLSIVRNCCHTWIERHRRDRPAAGDDVLLSIADPRAAADETAVRSSERARIQQAFDALTPELREVIVLREVQDLSYRQIAEVVGVPMGTVMSRLSRARDRMAALLGGAREAS